MNSLLIFTSVADILLPSTLDKQHASLRDQAGFEAGLNQGDEELRSLDAQFATLGTITTDKSLLKQNQAHWVKNALKVMNF